MFHEITIHLGVPPWLSYGNDYGNPEGLGVMPEFPRNSQQFSADLHENSNWKAMSPICNPISNPKKQLIWAKQE